MPRTLVTAPGHDRNRSLGFLACAWIEFLLRHGSGSVQGLPVELVDEYAGFIADCYALSPGDAHSAPGRRLYDAAFWSRGKGAAKSSYAGMIALFEALGPCRFSGWAKGGEIYEDPWQLGFSYEYEPGEPMGKPVHVPIIRIMATEESQSSNVYDTIFFNLTDDECPLSAIPGIDPGRTRVYLPGGGQILPSTASSASKDGGRETHVIFDETHLYTSMELKRAYQTVTRNLVKRKAFDETWFIETTTMFAPGEESIAEGTFREAELTRTDKRRRGRSRLLYDHRYGECDDLADEEQLAAAITDAYGEAMQWIDLQAVLDEFYSLKAHPSDSRRYFLNAETSSSDSWIEARELDACKRPELSLRDGEVVTLGFDGSINDDSTCLVAVSVETGHMELLHVQEIPSDLPAGAEWRVDEEAVDAAVQGAFKRFRVVGFFADPAHWSSWTSQWHSRYAHKLKAKALGSRPIEFWTNRRLAIARALEQFWIAVKGQQVTFTPAEDRIEGERANAVILRRHILNARRKPTAEGLLIRKELPKSSKKIDGAMAATLAWAARLEAIKAGVKTGPQPKRIPKRVR